MINANSTLGDYLNQGEYWFTRENGLVRVKDMELAHRRSSARWLIKNSGHIYQLLNTEEYVTAPEAPGLEEMIRWVSTRPSQWIKETALLKALVEDLPPMMALDVA